MRSRTVLITGSEMTQKSSGPVKDLMKSRSISIMPKLYAYSLLHFPELEYYLPKLGIGIMLVAFVRLC